MATDDWYETRCAGGCPAKWVVGRAFMKLIGESRKGNKVAAE